MRNSLLVILTMGPCYGSQLKAEFERRTGGFWPLNVGQVYTTLARLERDGLAVRRGTDRSGRERFEITDAGRAAVGAWHRSPAPAATAQRDEFVMKAVVALTVPGTDVAGILDVQERHASAELARSCVHASPQALLVGAARDDQLRAQLSWIERVRRTDPMTPWGLDADLPKRGRPHKEAGEPAGL